MNLMVIQFVFLFMLNNRWHSACDSYSGPIRQGVIWTSVPKECIPGEATYVLPNPWEAQSPSMIASSIPETLYVQIETITIDWSWGTPMILTWKLYSYVANWFIHKHVHFLNKTLSGKEWYDYTGTFLELNDLLPCKYHSVANNSIIITLVYCPPPTKLSMSLHFSHRISSIIWRVA